MQNVTRYLLVLALVLLSAGCRKREKFDGPTVDAFHGQLLSDGKPVSFSADEVVKINLIHKDSAERFGIPIKADGSFEIGWMPIGDYMCSLERKKGGSERQGQFESTSKPISGGLRIEEGKTEYEIELGENF